MTKRFTFVKKYIRKKLNVQLYNYIDYIITTHSKYKFPCCYSRLFAITVRLPTKYL